MNDHLFGARRATPVHTPVEQDDAAVNIVEISPMQEVAAANPSIQDPAPSPLEDYTISVQQVREHLRAKGLTKSKDTIQRWCREGDLECQKLGVLGRYFTTENSLLQLEQKLLPDMIAEGAGANAAAHTSTQLQGSAVAQDVQSDAVAKTETHAEVTLHAAEDAAASRSMQEQVLLDAASRDGMPETAEVAQLKAEVIGLTKQLEQSQEINTFLREEIVSARGQRGDVVKIAEQMLGTLETMAVGGRLEKASRSEASSRGEAVRYQPAPSERDAV